MHDTVAVDRTRAALGAALEAGTTMRREARDIHESNPTALLASAAVRILVVDPQAYTPWYDHALCEALAARGHDVELVTATFLHGASPAPNGYRRRESFGPTLKEFLRARPRSPLRAPLKLAGHVAGLASLAARARRRRPDIVHWQWAPLPRLDLPALRRVPSRGTLFTAHDVLPRRSAGAVERWRALYDSCDRVITHSENGRARLLGDVGVDPARVVIVPHPVLPDNDAAEPPDRHAPGETVLFFGLLRPDKGLDVLIEALPALAERVPGVRLEVVGSPRMPIEPLRERAEALGVADRIAWDLRFVSDAEAADAFARATVVCLPYREIENSGVLAEAIRHGVVPVTTAVGGLPETLARYDLPAPVPIDDAGALAGRLAEALTDEHMRARATAGMRRARNELTWGRAAETHEALYRDVIAERQG
jgi:glycosyltransferase involved in cell wall biosynthesis